MKKTLLVAWDEYSRHVFNKRFLMGLLSVPLVGAAMVGLIFLIFAINNDIHAIGYVDHSGLLANPVQAPPVEWPDRQVEFIPYASETDARQALDTDSVQAYFIIPQDYRTSGSLRVVHVRQLRDLARYQFYDFLAANLLADASPAVSFRLLDGSEVVVQSLDGSRSFAGEGFINVLMPLVIAIFFLVAMFTSGGYLMQAVVEEKENRTIEVLMTSLSANQFMTGKIIGDIGIGFTQLLVWFGFIATGILLLREPFEFLQVIQIRSEIILLVAVIVLPAFIMVSALMAAIGATVTEAREGQQMTGLISLPMWIPYMLMGVLLTSPNSPLAVTISLLPFTSVLALLIRQGVTFIPAWQIVVSSIVQVLGAAFSIWIAGRAFRLGMLRYGKRLRWRELFSRQGGKA